MTKAGLIKNGPDGNAPAADCYAAIAVMEERGGFEPVPEMERLAAEHFFMYTPYDLFVSLNTEFGYNVPGARASYAIPGGPDIGYRGLPGKVMLMLDSKFDDGKPGSGTIVAENLCRVNVGTVNEEYNVELLNQKDDPEADFVCVLAIASDL